MLEILRDPVWQFILGSAAIMISLLIYRLQTNRRIVTYEITRHSPLLQVPEYFENEVQILFKKEPVLDISIIYLRIRNAGNSPILPEDFNKAISCDFGKEAQILLTDAWGEPKSVKPSILTDPSKHAVVEVAPLLLNRGDSIHIGALLTGYKGELNIEGRVVGVKEIKLAQDYSYYYWRYFIVFFLGLMTSSMLFAIGWRLSVSGESYQGYFVVIAILLLMYFYNFVRRMKTYYLRSWEDILDIFVSSFVISVLSYLMVWAFWL